MPYKIVQEGNKFKVVAQNTGHVAGTHPSKEKAKAQMAALYANEPEARKCMTCGCDDLGNDHHYISDTEKCSYCVEKGQGPCWDGYEYAGTKEKDGKTVPNCIPSKVKKMEFSGGNNASHPFTIDFNTPDCLGGYSVIKAGTAQSIGCYITREEAEKQLDALVVGDRSSGNDTDNPVKKSDGIGQLSFWNGSFAPVFGSMFGDARYNSTFNTPPSRDGKPTAGYGNQTGYGYSNQ
jgi:hypothetical protein